MTEANQIPAQRSPQQRKLVVLGAAESGIGAALLAQQQGYDVFVSDGGAIKPSYKIELQKAGIAFEEQGHTEHFVLLADEVVKSPGIPEKAPIVQALRRRKIPVISEVELAYRFAGDSKIVAITGSNGKSTVTSLIYHICRNAGLDCALVGNIGISFAWQIVRDPKPLYIAEISSFQLDDIQQFKPHVAVLLNITEDHLDRYDYQFENYIAAKFRLIENQSEDNYFIYNLDDEAIARHLTPSSLRSIPLPFSMKQEVKKGAYIKGDQLNVRLQGDDRTQYSIHDFALKGKHNQSNTMAAAVAAQTLGIRKDKIREAVGTYTGLAHRTEMVATVRGVDFINDSKATNINSTWIALENMQQPTILILGGIDKGNDYATIFEMVEQKVRGIVCIGKDNSAIREALAGKVKYFAETDNMTDCVSTAFAMAKKGDTVLLSPACASFDLFKNFEDRGDQFKEAVMKL